MSDVSQRLAYYKAFASAEDRYALEKSTEALVDCYGKLPDPARRLIDIHRLRLRCEAIGIRRIAAAAEGIIIIFTQKPNLDPLALIKFLQSRTDAQMLGPEKLKLKGSSEDPEKRLAIVYETLARLSSQGPGSGSSDESSPGGNAPSSGVSSKAASSASSSAAKKSPQKALPQKPAQTTANVVKATHGRGSRGGHAVRAIGPRRG